MVFFLENCFECFKWFHLLLNSDWTGRLTHFFYLISRNKIDSEMSEVQHTQGLSEYVNTQLRLSLSFKIFKISFWQTRNYWIEIRYVSKAKRIYSKANWTYRILTIEVKFTPGVLPLYRAGLCKQRTLQSHEVS